MSKVLQCVVVDHAYQAPMASLFPAIIASTLCGFIAIDVFCTLGSGNGIKVKTKIEKGMNIIIRKNDFY